MANCTGKRKPATCGSPVFNCSKCANVGCDQLEVGECSNQGFSSGICTQCGAVRMTSEMGHLVITPQLREAIRRLRWTLPDE
jgi:hypothetical protein